MRIAVTSIGSEGDIRPYVALAKGLRAAGHDAFLVCAEVFAERAHAAGVPWRNNGMPVTIERFRAFMARVMTIKNPLEQVRFMFEEAAPNLISALPHLRAAAQDADLIVHHQIDLAAYTAARLANKPRIPGVLFHSSLPMRGSTLSGRNLGVLLNRVSSGLMRYAFRLTTDKPSNRVLTNAGLPEEKGPLLNAAESPLGTLVAISPEVIPTDPLWEGRYIQTGYWFLDEPDFSPGRRLAEFLAAGEPPVVVTFGSMAGDPTAQTRALLEGLNGRRAIIQAGVAQLGEGELGPNVLRVDYVPHDWLFARARCVLHHGGAGTTAAALRAGVPQGIVYHMGDQPHWGTIVARRGIGPRPIAHHKLCASWVELALSTAGEPQVQVRAKELGARVRKEDGVGNAVRAIEAAMSRTARVS